MDGWMDEQCSQSQNEEENILFVRNRPFIETTGKAGRLAKIQLN